MSAVAPPDPSQTASTAPKKKNNKKKKSAKGKGNGDTVTAQEVLDSPVENKEGGQDGEDSESVVSTPKDAHFPETTKSQANGHNYDETTNGDAIEPSSRHSTTNQLREQDTDRSDNSVENKAPGTVDASSRFEAMSQEREALRAEVEQLRKSLEDIQGRHNDEISTIKNQHSQELATIQENHMKEVATVKSQHEEEISTVRAELEESQSATEQAETQYQHLLDRVNTIKASLGERLKADKEELSETKDRIDELETLNEALQKQIQGLEEEVKQSKEELNESSKELSSLRNRYNLSQQNWVHERDDLLQQARQFRDEADAARDAMGDWEVLAMEEKRMREGLVEKIADLEEQFSSQKEAYEAAVAERDTQSQALGGLQRALQEVQEARKRELREMVETYEEQLQSLKKLVQESDTRAAEADASKGALQTELDRLAPFEREVREKNLLIGKLRHEAIVLNDHLTKALRFLKKAKPEDNVDRQIVTNHFLHFLALDRSDPKKFQVLQLIAALLNWTDEQKEQAGLARPGTSNNSLRLPTSPFLRAPSTPTLSSDFFTEPSSNSKETLADLWSGFLERSAEESSVSGSRSGSVSSSAPRSDTRGGEGNSKE